jgi:hypothetical protein
MQSLEIRNSKVKVTGWEANKLYIETYMTPQLDGLAFSPSIQGKCRSSENTFL